MKRNIIKIDEELCNGCGLCIDACHEGALALVDGKAKLISDSYCDGLGHCLPECPTGAISIIEREADAYDEELVLAKQQAKAQSKSTGGCGCPSSQARSIVREEKAPIQTHTAEATSELRSWPVQIQLVPVNAPYFQGAHLLIAADCTAFAYANIHKDFMRGKITLIGCPKLDTMEYTEKLREIIRQNDIQSVTILRMEVPCCAGLVTAAKNALQQSGKMIPWNYHTVSIQGELLDQ